MVKKTFNLLYFRNNKWRNWRGCWKAGVWLFCRWSLWSSGSSSGTPVPYLQPWLFCTWQSGWWISALSHQSQFLDWLWTLLISLFRLYAIQVEYIFLYMPILYIKFLRYGVCNKTHPNGLNNFYEIFV